MGSVAVSTCKISVLRTVLVSLIISAGGVIGIAERTGCICFVIKVVVVVILFSKSSLDPMSVRTSTYVTGKIPFLLPTRPSNQFGSTRRVNETSSPLFKDNSNAVCARKLNFARACPSDGFLIGGRTSSFVTIYK